MPDQVIDGLCRQVARLLAPAWRVTVDRLQDPQGRAQAWFELRPLDGGDGRWLVFLHPSGGRERLVEFLALAEEPLQACAAGRWATLLALDPEDPRTLSLLGPLGRGLGLAALPGADREVLRAEAARARIALREADARTTAPAPAPAPPPPSLDREAVLRGLAARVGGGWNVDDRTSLSEPSWRTVVLSRRVGETTTGVWWVFPGDVGEPERALAVASQLAGSVAPFRQLGSCPRWTVFTWAAEGSADSRAVAAELELGPPHAALEGNLRGRG